MPSACLKAGRNPQRPVPGTATLNAGKPVVGKFSSVREREYRKCTRVRSHVVVEFRSRALLGTVLQAFVALISPRQYRQGQTSICAQWFGKFILAFSSPDPLADGVGGKLHRTSRP